MSQIDFSNKKNISQITSTPPLNFARRVELNETTLPLKMTKQQGSAPMIVDIKLKKELLKAALAEQVYIETNVGTASFSKWLKTNPPIAQYMYPQCTMDCSTGPHPEFAGDTIRVMGFDGLIIKSVYCLTNGKLKYFYDI